LHNHLHLVYTVGKEEIELMRFPKYVKGQGITEYLLFIIIFILSILIIVKLFGPAISNFIQNFLQNV